MANNVLGFPNFLNTFISYFKNENTAQRTYTFPDEDVDFGDYIDNGTYTAYVPTFTGFSADPGTIIARYKTFGKFCHVYISMGSNGTSNATTFTVTLPFAAANTVQQVGTNVITIDNGTTGTTPGRCDTRVNSNILDVYRDCAAASWTASGGKRARIILSYEIA